MGTEPANEDVPAKGSKSRSVRITEIYHEYTPPFAVEPIVRRMLDSVPEKYLKALSEVVLTNTSGLSRARRRSVTKSRNRKVRQATALGLYHPAWKAQPAWIEIFVDNTLRRWERGFWLGIPFIREALLSDVLFHEVGHHIHYTSRPEHKEREDVADTWKVKLQRNHSRIRHPLLRAITLPLRPLIRALGKLLAWKMFQKGAISRAEYEVSFDRNPNLP